MRLSKVLALPSIDSDGVCFPEYAGGCTRKNRTVLSALRYKSLDHALYRVIEECMRLDRINGFPIEIAMARDIADSYGVFLPHEIDPRQLMMGQGHHRVMIAVRLQLPAMLFTDELSGRDL